jgi:hypothetical protein
MKKEIEQNKENVILRITLPIFSNIDYPNKVKITDNDAKRILEKENIKIGNLITGPGILRNFRNPGQLSAEWIFELPKEETVKQEVQEQEEQYRNSSKNRRRSKKSKKTLDNFHEDVIIEEENINTTEEEEHFSSL